MIRWLLPLFLGLSLLSVAAEPLHAQYVFLDLNDDGECNAQDIPVTYDPPETVDVWIDTSRNRDGSPATCTSGETLTIASYELIIQAASSLSIVSWTNVRPEFPIQEHLTIQGSVAWVGYTSENAATHLAPGKYRLGRAGFQPSGAKECPYLTIVEQNPSVPLATTQFYSQCLGFDLDNFVRFGREFSDACGAYVSCDDVESTTWGHIKDIYR